MTRREGFWNVYSQTREIPFSIWPSLEQNDPLNYGQKIVTFKSANMGRQTRIYQAEKDGSVSLKGKSPAIKLLSANLEYAWRNWRYSVAEKNWYYTDESKDPGWYYHYKFKVTDDEEVADIELPSSVGSVKTESIENGYVCEFYSDNKNWKNIQATDYDYKGSIYSGGVSWRYFK
jgi:hypothetical protein